MGWSRFFRVLGGIMEIFGWGIASVLAMFYVYMLYLLGKDVFVGAKYHEKQTMRDVRQSCRRKHHDK